MNDQDQWREGYALITGVRIQFIGGTHIEEAAKKMVELAGRGDVYVEATFNGRELWAYGNRTSEDIVQTYRQGVRSEVEEPNILDRTKK